MNKLRNTVNRESQFQKLYFSQDSRTLREIQEEVNTDIKMFLECIKNSVFFGSGISRFYNQELDIYRRRFLDLEDDKRTWSQLVFKYIHLNNGVSNIPAPKMQDEIENRKAIAKKAKCLANIMQTIT